MSLPGMWPLHALVLAAVAWWLFFRRTTPPESPTAYSGGIAEGIHATVGGNEGGNGVSKAQDGDGAECRELPVELEEKPLASWTVREVSSFLGSIQLGSYVEVFVKNVVDGAFASYCCCGVCSRYVFKDPLFNSGLKYR